MICAIFTFDFIDFLLHFGLILFVLSVLDVLLFLDLLGGLGSLAFNHVLHGFAHRSLFCVWSKLLSELFFHLFAQVVFHFNHFGMKGYVSLLLDLLKLSLAFLEVALLLLEVVTDFVDVLLALFHACSRVGITQLGRGCIVGVHALV